MSKLEQIQAFIEIAHQHSFAGAARTLSISTPAISRQIALLESHLSTPLFKRTTRKVTLTTAGELYLQACTQALEKLTSAEDALQASTGVARGTLRIMASRYFALYYIIPRLAEFKAQNSELTIYLDLAERFPDLSEESVDILFGVSMEGPPHLVRKRVAQTRYVLCASPAYLEKNGTPKTPAELKNHTYLTHRMRTDANEIQLDKQIIRLTPALYLNDSYALRECAMLNFGLANLHDYIVADAIKAGDLIEVLADFQQQQHFVYLYYQQDQYIQPKIRRFIDFMVP